MQKKVCQFYLKGCCRYGKDCKNSHDVPVPMNTTNTQSNTQSDPNYHNSNDICRYFLTSKCNKGEKCEYFHGYCDRLKHVKTIDDHKNEINNLVKMDDTKYISSDNQIFYVRFSGSDEKYGNNIDQPYTFGKLIYSLNKVVCAVQKSGM